MKRVLVGALLGLLSFSGAFGAEDVALWMVKTTGLGRNLESMGFQVARRTQTYGTMVGKIGEENTAALMKEELGRALPKYQEQWDRNLAECYRERFAPEELKSIVNEKRASKHYAKFVSEREAVGASMQVTSNGLLQAFVQEATISAFKRAMQSQ